MPPWKEIHISDNERFETYDESLLINDCLLKTYRLFGYDVRIVPKDTVPKRVDFILDTINSTM
jgi:predicted ATPase